MEKLRRSKVQRKRVRTLKMRLIMAEDRKYNKMPLFDESNFNNWKFRMEILLEEYDLIEYVYKSPEEMANILPEDIASVRAQKESQHAIFKANDRKCKSQIIKHIADSHLEYVKDKSTAHGM